MGSLSRAADVKSTPSFTVVGCSGVVAVGSPTQLNLSRYALRTLFVDALDEGIREP